ncbi:MAG: hypothetical protein UX12_C0001G0002 [Candidatus Collierbacteria bacterium GW2011_GWC1_45_47]|uniref:Uncharacterized protein n=4 Tax=Candidatus Collieribacteriota TaxID=1752725 RepID=A0A0G1JT51_9BACT|nr:MAG: hypothetical protein UW23_C0006G0005 [Candidatus Collierbacteria bacterium GW2011_GWA1_44_12]KKT39535.1 MAG: hypothetical protein UW26_C0001G0022 [Candidatus Collierbacteria bacterium GW2011_GWF1_44_12]KKT47087.1 MAG: hypothetical protein UW35_C0003G0024 [Candidatus Collierbacteria bacterium GW2011_GWF2_44_15]KKT98149.1 MAG: hypothetical protein UW99_C0025G0001 [Candidatus Collierbacteria bacterium GW2011_GWC2_45_15]KKU09806.1 MAG: hypothetical protein UX12_C0001G0002 [Candidatus Collie
MPIPGKEIEQRPGLDQTAIREVEGYIERVERQAETQAQVQSVSQVQVTQPVAQQQQDMGSLVSAQLADVTKPKIILPLNQVQIEEGMHHKIVDGIKWLAEWCVMMIKKYPGRVFYLPPNQQT